MAVSREPRQSRRAFSAGARRKAAIIPLLANLTMNRFLKLLRRKGATRPSAPI
jgi:hypothetical protein